ncbi:hypothetical protein G5C60_10420 [Streptomyces sp. HC44]|uniref:Uncharacterized protein n=1 Tax=Streptomyces scabichelini TaxID=2711217 RepID=A0A6G4V1X3_9ACTN|nr:hypothetical protein [Streptomyces scabichelini]NGO08052.1 hypothetical protein [Streptomyces scabichelini]
MSGTALSVGGGLMPSTMRAYEARWVWREPWGVDGCVLSRRRAFPGRGGRWFVTAFAE